LAVSESDLNDEIKSNSSDERRRRRSIGGCHWGIIVPKIDEGHQRYWHKLKKTDSIRHA
jgi:hypothetical protein